MKISIEWLKEYVDVPEAPARLKEDLTLSGLVVESVMESDGNTVLELEITSNRPDCLSHVGVAREVAALYQRPLRMPPLRKRLQLRTDKLPYSVEILDPKLCPRYVGLVMDGIRVAPSPSWMQRRLNAAGMRPVNNIVDITNYVLLELGHPLHAFDFNQLRRGKIVVARARGGQKMTTLDGIERVLDEEMLLINDGEGPVAIAGVMGGLHSEISESTRIVLLECAYFDPLSVRRTAKKLGLSTEASYRFERGADWDNTVRAIARTCTLIEEHAGGRIAGGVQDVYPTKINPVAIELHRARAESLLGVKLTDDFVESTLRRLNFKLVRRGRSAWQVTCPTYRADMELEADLIEELARFHGYQNIPTTIPPARSAGIPSPVHHYESTARRILLGLGYSEAVNLSFAGESEHQEFPPQGGGGRVAIRNPLTEETQFMRSTLAPGLVRSARRNFNYDLRQVSLFEIGNVYRSGPDGKPVERATLGILATGDFAKHNWAHPEGSYDFFHLKGVVMALLQGMRSAPAAITPVSDVPWLNSADASAISIDGQCVGVVGSLHPELEEKYKLKQPVFLAEIDYAALCRLAFTSAHYEPLPKYPAAERDLSILVGRDATYGAIRSGIEGLGIGELVKTDLIDVYEGNKVPQGKISLTLRLTFQDREKTLTVDRVQGFSDNILNYLKNTIGAILR
jgi:phenylalanyl-tRNA synthetase beta chain